VNFDKVVKEPGIVLKIENIKIPSEFTQALKEADLEFSRDTGRKNYTVRLKKNQFGIFEIPYGIQAMLNGSRVLPLIEYTGLSNRSITRRIGSLNGTLAEKVASKNGVLYFMLESMLVGEAMRTEEDREIVLYKYSISSSKEGYRIKKHLLYSTVDRDILLPRDIMSYQDFVEGLERKYFLESLDEPVVFKVRKEDVLKLKNLRNFLVRTETNFFEDENTFLIEGVKESGAYSIPPLILRGSLLISANKISAMLLSSKSRVFFNPHTKKIPQTADPQNIYGIGIEHVGDTVTLLIRKPYTTTSNTRGLEVREHDIATFSGLPYPFSIKDLPYQEEVEKFIKPIRVIINNAT
jgi:hypothetical protein